MHFVKTKRVTKFLIVFFHGFTDYEKHVWSTKFIIVPDLNSKIIFFPESLHNFIKRLEEAKIDILNVEDFFLMIKFKQVSNGGYIVTESMFMEIVVSFEKILIMLF